MVRSKLGRALVQTLLCIVLPIALLGCPGGKGDTGDQQAETNDQFVSDGGAGGTLSIRVTGALTVAGTTTFSVTALDPRGAPLAFIRIFCESERGIAILEPNSGGTAFESTSSDGSMSGVLGGLLPGSYLFECRGPQGFNLVDRVSITIRGTIPAGFEGFPGAAGGNLGGGAFVEPPTDVTVTSVDFIGEGGNLGQSGPIDILQASDCNLDGIPTDPEPFAFNDYELKILNEFTQDIFITSVTFAVGDGRGVSATQSYASIPINAGAELTLTGAFTEFSTIDGSKTFAGTAFAVIAGTYPVTFTVSGTTAAGSGITITATATVVFGNVNNC